MVYQDAVGNDKTNFLHFKLGNVPIRPTENNWMNTCPSRSSEPIRPLDALLTVPSYTAKGHHHF